MDQPIYHVFNRGVEKRDIFIDTRDYLRFLQNLYEFNNKLPVITRTLNYEEEKLTIRSEPRDTLVDIFAFCLMPNHFHLMIREKELGNLTEFMRKLGSGYTNYFNKKYERVGHLFQGKYRSVLLETESHFSHLPHYIHLNPIDLFPKDRPEEKLTKLGRYRWSSFPHYAGKENFGEIIDSKFLKDYLGNAEHVQKETLGWIKERTFDFTDESYIDASD